MKVNGVESGDRETALFGPLVFKRGKKFLAFRAAPVWDLEEFNALCPAPVNEYHRFTKNGREKDPDAPGWKDQLKSYSRKRWGYTVLKSLEPSNIEWDNVSLDDADTWEFVEEELRANLAIYEYAALMSLVDEANGIDQAKLEENAESFFRQQRAEDTPENSQKDDPENTSSTAPVSDSE